MNRRKFLQATAAGLGGGLLAGSAAASGNAIVSENAMGMLVDLSVCVGCRKCEFACAREHGLSDAPLEVFEDTAVYDESRRMRADAFTVVNRYPPNPGSDKPVFVKIQCMHCLRPACESACLVGALRRQENGAVTYDAQKCMGCRYCMVACPFQVPAYEYAEPFTPRVRKCNFCAERTREAGEIPACAAMCPPMALTYGKRSELIELARAKIAEHPDRYINHIYGEHEAGGTAWLYLAPRAFEELGFLPLDDAPIPEITETLQHGLFRFGALPVFFFGMLGALMRLSRDSDASPAGAQG